jgi:hypothetical protein
MSGGSQFVEPVSPSGSVEALFLALVLSEAARPFENVALIRDRRDR